MIMKAAMSQRETHGLGIRARGADLRAEPVTLLFMFRTELTRRRAIDFGRAAAMLCRMS